MVLKNADSRTRLPPSNSSSAICGYVTGGKLLDLCVSALSSINQKITQDLTQRADGRLK